MQLHPSTPPFCEMMVRPPVSPSSTSAEPAPPPAYVLRGHVEAVSVVRFGVDGRVLYSGSTTGELRAWDLSSRRTVASHQAHPRGVLTITPLGPDKILTQGKDGYVRQWSVDSDFRLEASLQTGCCSFGRSCFSEELGVIASPGQDPSAINLFDRQTGAVVRSFSTGTHAGMAMALAWMRPSCEDGVAAGPKFLAGAFEDGRMYVWEIAGATDMPVLAESLHSEPATCIDFCGMRGASGSAAGDVPVFDVDAASPPACNVVARLRLGNKPGVNDLRVRRSDGKIFATAGWDHRVRVWAWRRPRPLAVLRFHVASVTSVDFNPICRSVLASASQDTRIAIWSLY